MSHCYQARKNREEFLDRNLSIRVIRFLEKHFNTLILSYSGGTDSTLLLLLFKEFDLPLDLIIYNNTRLEYQDTIKYIPQIIEKLEYESIFKEIKPKKTTKELLDMIMEDFEKYYTYSKHYKDQYRCCYYAKKMPLVYYLKNNNLDEETTCVLMGIRANESSLRLTTALKLVENGRFYFHNFKHCKYAKQSNPIQFITDSTKTALLEKLCSKYNIDLPETSGCSICPIFYKFASDEEKTTKRYKITANFLEKKARNLITSYLKVKQTA